MSQYSYWMKYHVNHIDTLIVYCILMLIHILLYCMIFIHHIIYLYHMTSSSYIAGHFRHIWPLTCITSSIYITSHFLHTWPLTSHHLFISHDTFSTYNLWSAGCHTETEILQSHLLGTNSRYNIRVVCASRVSGRAAVVGVLFLQLSPYLMSRRYI